MSRLATVVADSLNITNWHAASLLLGSTGLSTGRLSRLWWRSILSTILHGWLLAEPLLGIEPRRLTSVLMLALEMFKLAFLLGIFTAESFFSQDSLVHQGVEIRVDVSH